jgi:ABC-type glycerol-3-phosphate transport system permease component
MDLFKTSKKQKVLMRGFLILLALIWLIPIYSALMNSLKYGGVKNYIAVLTEPINDVYFYRYFVNSGIIAVIACVMICFFSSCAGFAFSKIRFPGCKTIYIIILLCLAIPGTVLIVPLFHILKTLGIYNTYWAVIFPETVLTLPFGVLMFKNYFDSLPTDLMEAAEIDGAGKFRTFFDVYLPMSKPCLLNLSVLCFMWSLQDFLLPTMFLTDGKLATATVAISTFKGVYGTVGSQLGRFNAALVLVAVPSLVLLVFGQKYLVGGLTSGSLKD